MTSGCRGTGTTAPPGALTHAAPAPGVVVADVLVMYSERHTVKAPNLAAGRGSSCTSKAVTTW